MRVLVLGGTHFLGRHIVEALLARAHDVTLFHRGNTGLDLFPEASRVLGDRATDLDRLPPDARWDAVVDVAAYVPKDVAASAGTLRERAARYVFVSSVSVFDLDRPEIDESSPMLDLPADASRDVMVPETYGALKRLCELEAIAAFGADRTLVVRPGLIVGPYDPTDRFTYWPLRFARGGDVLVPDDLDARTQWIDARDIADFITLAIERGIAGEVNVVGPSRPTTLRDLFADCAEGAGVASRLVAVPVETLDAHGVKGWSDLPCWIARGRGYDAITHVCPMRAEAMGLRHRPLATTLSDTLRWARDARTNVPLEAGLTPEREADILAAL